MVEVFSSNVQTEEWADMLMGQLKRAYPAYLIDFDLEDCDNILRVESHHDRIDVTGIRQVVKDFGFSVEVLPDVPVSKRTAYHLSSYDAYLGPDFQLPEK